MVLVLYTGDTLQHKLQPQAVLRERLEHLGAEELDAALQNGQNGGDNVSELLKSERPVFVPALGPAAENGASDLTGMY